MPTHIDALANVYARSLFELAEEVGGREKIAELGQELEQICELARGDASFREFLASPIIEQSARSDALHRMFNNRVSDTTLRFLLMLNRKGRLGHMEQINSAYDRLVNERYDRIEVDVFTAGPLGEEQLESLREQIRSAINKDPVVHAYTDAEMIGGIKLRIGDQLIDGSIANRLRRMKNQMLTRGPSRLRERLSDIIEEGGAP